MPSAINEKRFFKLLPFFFSNPNKVVVELIQNAQRSGADRANIDYNDGILKVSDNGSGTRNPIALLKLADSDWNDEVMANANPAGFGLFFLFSVAESVTVRSLFGELTINCPRYLEDETYRLNIFEEIIPQGKIEEGFHVIAVLKESVSMGITGRFNFSTCLMV